MLRIFLLSLIISHMGFIFVQSKEQIEENFFDTVHQLIDQDDFFQAKAVLIQEISQNLFLAKRFDYENYQNVKSQVFKRLTGEYENIPLVFCQLFENISWKDMQKELTAYQEKIQRQMQAFFVSVSTQDSFYQLPLLEEDKKNISIIIKTMAEKGLLKLLLLQNDLEKKGDQVNYIHPLRFIGYIFSNEELKNCMRQIKTSRFKWNEFIKGFSHRMDEEYAVDNLIRFIPEFVEQVYPQHPERIEVFIKKKSWEEFVTDLLN
ncbi:hypothetical protein RHABOEDO_000197 [Candidatus Rhabdochlamydia oedothoracis]|uniref:DUF2059 domain-containing protein n=1 Tax=Candidatus Rhabdochlamydia oedothoracis TaxID=2720720 RepID=A0ABX8V0R7_9BACT|nr:MULTISPECIES: hypothetical protein [Rhabdochlamydia]KAG6559949.1 hypothetical protein RHOW815_000030 [Candidatus Rhabdochlamydia sp. W815]MCL6756122.1 hypothetical protein [Candidatus Rhabdochlamydia oedothoracis]QYF48097.1 hypothetical protein RHABOEDO_000197 [Candidatus Rhabdochlamydia oedothoracis]